MKRKSLIIFLLFLLSYPCFSQAVDYVKEMENSDLQIRQKPDSERLLSEFLGRVGMEEDTVYAILYRPSYCYRCEFAIPTFYEDLKRNNPNNKMLLITAYRDSVAARGYNEKNNFKADYHLYDTTEEYSKIFSFTTGNMLGLYQLKLCPKSGVLITGGQCTLFGKDFIRQLVARSERLEPRLFPVDSLNQAEAKTQEPVFNLKPYPWKTKDTRVELNEGSFVSSVYYNPKIENNHFFFTDMLNNGVMLFGKTDKGFKYRTLIQANEAEKRRFIAIPDSFFDRFTREGSVFYIALTANMIDDKHIGISYSLPQIEEEEGKKFHFAFYNAPVMLVRDIDNLQAEEMIVPDFNLEASKYFYTHFTFDVFNNKLWYECQKLTWPHGFEKEDIAGNTEMDPFDNGFYNTFNPIMASFDISSGKRTELYGKLEDCQRISNTGYYFLNTVFTHHGKDMLYGNGYTGKLYLADSLNIGRNEKEYKVFDVDLSAFPAPDTTKFYMEEYGGLYHPHFTRCITLVRMNAKEIYCLLKYGVPRHTDPQNERYAFVTINRKSGKTTERTLPALPEGTRCLGYGIRNEHDCFNPFVFIQEGSDYKVRDFISK
ncbi:hypothetical protein HPS56_01285 [Prevotella sp. PMUR]|uniref:Thioredoxin domain-containing protein n=2 Tax=Xylanibacter muris TaxID=2736290 RepID=A0ABX2AIV5_9BACT|nr:hypothetical protein [Xylanibacter muris]